MAGLLIQIPELPETTSVADSDLIHLRQGTIDKKIAYDDIMRPHTEDYGNPHQVNKSQLGLNNLTGNVVLEQDNNLSDVQSASLSRNNLDVPSNTDLSDHVTDTTNPHSVTKSQLGLSNLTGAVVLEKLNNLSDLDNAGIARTNLDVYSKSEVNAINQHVFDYNNPHQVTKDQLGLGNLTGAVVLEKNNNLSDVQSTATSRTNLSVYSKSEVDSFNQHFVDYNNPHQVSKSQLGLGNLTGAVVLEQNNNLSDVQSTAIARANLDVPSTGDLTSHTSDSNNPHSVTKTQLGLGNLTGAVVLEKNNNLSDVASVSTSRTNLDVYSKAESLNLQLPAGSIIMWSGAIALVPTGYVYCDGSNGTPDLRSRFVIGASTSGTYTVDATGGSSSSSHGHNVTSASHALTINEMPSHRHSCDMGHLENQSGLFGTNGTSWPTHYTNYEGGGASHKHTLTQSDVTVNTIPPYYALAYIMKT